MLAAELCWEVRDSPGFFGVVSVDLHELAFTNTCSSRLTRVRQSVHIRGVTSYHWLIHLWLVE